MPLAGVGRSAVVPLLMLNAPVDVNDESEVAVRVVHVRSAKLVGNLHKIHTVPCT
jgi:hypothetical protein